MHDELDVLDGTRPLPADLARFAARIQALPLPAEPDWDAAPLPRPVPVVLWSPRAQALAVAAALLLVLGMTMVWFNGWRVESLSGRAHFGGVAFAGRMPMGGVLETPRGCVARMEVPGLGEVTLEPGSRLRRVRAEGEVRRLQLERGTLHARISAPPRLFVVGTSVGDAVDLGCAYTLAVDDSGKGRLEVTEGRVLFDQGGLENLLPAGLWCPIDANGAGVPRRTFASDAFLAALAETDSPECQSDDYHALLEQAEASDAITLWHMLPRVQGKVRRQIAERIASLIEVPSEVAIGRVLALEPAALEAWWDALGVGTLAEWNSPGRGLKVAR